MNGYHEVLAALEHETGARFGGVDASGTFGLFDTPCIGLSDQEPAMLVDDVVFTRLTPATVATIIGELKAGRTAAELANPAGLPTDTRRLRRRAGRVQRPHRRAGVLPEAHRRRRADRGLPRRTPAEIVELVTESDLRGRGGAGFATGLKWRLCANAAGAHKYVICNADEGEPGTFKDRVLLTRSPELVIAGMVIAAYAIGADNGIIYLRAEYPYLVAYLERQLQDFRDDGLLGCAHRRARRVRLRHPDPDGRRRLRVR